MNLFIDISNKRLIASSSSSMRANSPIFVRGDNELLVVNLYTYVNGVLNARSLLKGEILRVGIGKIEKIKSLYALSETESFEEDGSAKISLNLNTQSLAEVLQGIGSIEALLEIELCENGGNVTTILQTKCTVKNDVIYTEDIPETLPSISDLQEEILTLRNLLQQLTSSLGNVYDENGNQLEEKLIWRTTKISENVYTQKWEKIERE